MISKFHLKFWLGFYIVCTIIFLPRFIFASTSVNDDIWVDTTWTKANSPYIVERAFVIFDNATLNIEPGVEIKFNTENGPIGISVFGKIKALGTHSDPIYFTSNGDDILSNTDDEEFCDEEYDEEGNLISKTNCEYFDFHEPFPGDWRGITFIDSKENILENVLFNYGDNPLNFQNSNVNIKHLLITNSNTGILAYNESLLEVRDMTLQNLEQDALVLYNNTLMNFNNLVIDNVINNPVNVYNDSSLSGNYLDFFGSFLSSYTEAILIFNGSNLVLNNATFTDCPENSCITFFDSESFAGENSLIEINNTLFASGSGSALLTFSGKPTDAKITNSSFLDFSLFAIESYRDIANIDARNNYWGDTTGPNHETGNPIGLGGNIYGNNILFDPWLFIDPFNICEIDCFSNVLFLPGMQGSRLYGDLGKGEKELWFSRNDSYHEALFLNQEGKSINQIYTKNDTRNNGEKKETGILDEATILNIKIYDSLVSELRNLKSNQIINDYAFIPYDWRLALEDILNNGQSFGDKDKNLSYLEDGILEESFIYKELSKLASSSKNGKVSIISHSNGGLVTKALIEKLKENNDPLYEKIDKIFFVAVPQIGAPESLLALLFGTGVGPANIIMDQDTSRTFGENMPTMYNLLPRESYFNLVENKDPKKAIINFSNKTKFENKVLENAIEKYGNTIDSFIELEDYLKGGDGRIKPKITDLRNANIANTYLYDNAINVYEMLDNWTPHPNTKIYQVGGWGADTLVGIDYNLYQSGLNAPYLSIKNKVSVYGDGTVPLTSSVYMKQSSNIEKWYVDLEKYNNIAGNTVFKTEHAEILEIPNLLAFIQSKLKDTDFNDPENIVVGDKASLVSIQKKLIYTLHSPLYLGVFDDQGRFTGRDKDDNTLNEIPGVKYFVVGEVQSLSIPIELAHTLVLNGFDDGYFSLELDEFLDDNYSGNQIFEGIINTKNTVAKLVFENEDSLDDLKLLLDLEGDGEFELEYSPSKEEIKEITEMPEIIINNPGAVLIPTNNNNPAPAPLVLGESTENNEITYEINKQTQTPIKNQEVEIKKDNQENIENKTILENTNKTSLETTKVEPTKENQIVEEEGIETTQETEERITSLEKNKDYKYIIILMVSVLLLISFKYLFKIK